MSAIWHNDGAGWRVLTSVGFEYEQALHSLVEDAPQLLPLSGSPRLAIIGREVHLGSGYVDLLAVEPGGRLAVIEVKLAKNAEARRAVVAQVLAYAAYLRGMQRDELETLLGGYLQVNNHADLNAAVAASVQDASFDAASFDAGLQASLADGRFRLILVLDSAPDELVRLVGYLEQTASLVIDLITVTSYSMSGQHLLVPQRIDPGRQVEPQGQTSGLAAPSKGVASEGPDEFVAAIAVLGEPQRSELDRQLKWAQGVAQRGLARLLSFRSVNGYVTLLPFVKGENAGLVTLWSNGYPTAWRSVFERRAPGALRLLEKALEPNPIGRGTSIKAVTPAVLDILTRAYEEAAGIWHDEGSTSGP